MHAVEILFKKMHFPIFSNTVRIHALETFFQNTIHVSLIVFILRKNKQNECTKTILLKLGKTKKRLCVLIAPEMSQFTLFSFFLKVGGGGLARRFNSLTFQLIDTSTLNVKYPRHVNPTIIFIMFNP